MLSGSFMALYRVLVTFNVKAGTSQLKTMYEEMTINAGYLHNGACADVLKQKYANFHSVISAKEIKEPSQTQSDIEKHADSDDKTSHIQDFKDLAEGIGDTVTMMGKFLKLFGKLFTHPIGNFVIVCILFLSMASCLNTKMSSLVFSRALTGYIIGLGIFGTLLVLNYRNQGGFFKRDE